MSPYYAPPPTIPDHGALSGLADDDHTQYTTAAEATTIANTTAAGVVDAAPAALDTLNELAAALGDDANFATTVTTALAGKEPAGTVATHAAAADPHTGYVLESLIDAAGDLLVGTANDTVGRLAMGSALQTLRVNSGATALEYASSGGVTAIYGDGSDGVVNFDGTTTVLGLVPSSGVYTMTRDIFLASGSQVSGTAVVKCANFRIFCAGTFTIGSTATVHNDANAGSGSTAGSASSAGTLTANVAGGAGGSGAAGTAGTAVSTNALGAAGGAGGASSGGGVGGGPSGGNVTNSASNGLPRTYITAWFAATGNRWSGGAGGGGGSAAASSTGGGGGAGGLLLFVVAYDLVVNGTLRAAGGAGGAAGGTGTGAGGGGGGGGGVLVAIYHTKSGTASTFTAAANAPGGAGGALQGAGRTGAAGTNGAVFELVM